MTNQYWGQVFPDWKQRGCFWWQTFLGSSLHSASYWLCKIEQSYLMSPSLSFPIYKMRRIVFLEKMLWYYKYFVFLSNDQRKHCSCWALCKHIISPEELIQGSLMGTTIYPRHKYRHFQGPDFQTPELMNTFWTPLSSPSVHVTSHH